MGAPVGEERQAAQTKVLRRLDASLSPSPLTNRDAPVVQALLASRVAAGAGPNTVRKERGMIISFYAWAWRHGMSAPRRCSRCGPCRYRPAPRGARPTPYKRWEIRELWVCSTCVGRGLMPSGRLGDDEPVGPGLRSPDFALTTEELADIRPGRWQAERLKALARGIEAHEGVGGEVGEPDEVGVVDVDGVRLRVVAGKPPFTLAVRARVVGGDLAGVPLADPESSP